MAKTQNSKPHKDLTAKSSPTPYSWKNPKYTPDMCDRIQEWYAQGDSNVQVAHKLDICKETLYAWIQQYPEFAEAVKRGTTASEHWWTDLGTRQCKGEFKGSEKIWQMNMTNRFKWQNQVNVADLTGTTLDRSIKELKAAAELYKSREKDY